MSPLPASYLGVASPRPWRPGNEAADVVGVIAKDTFTNASTINAQKFVANHAGPNTLTRDMTLAATSQAHARALIVTVTHATAVVVCSGTIYGTDIDNRPIEENWSVTAGGTSKTYTTGKAFKTVTRITETAAADASGNTIGVGDSKVFGLSYKCASTTIYRETQDGTALAATGTLTVAATNSEATKDARGTYTPAATLNGALDFEIHYLVADGFMT